MSKHHNNNSGALVLGAILVALVFAGFIGLIFIVLPHLHGARQSFGSSEYDVHSYGSASGVVGHHVDVAAVSTVVQPEIVPFWVYTPRYQQPYYTESMMVSENVHHHAHSASVDDENASFFSRAMSIVCAIGSKTLLIVLGLVVPVLILVRSCICGVVRRIGGRVFRRRAVASSSASTPCQDAMTAEASAVAVVSEAPAPECSECLKEQTTAAAAASIVVDAPANIVHIDATAVAVADSNSCSCACAAKRRAVGDLSQSAACACLSCPCAPCGCASRQH